jgi:uncharacterized protein (TIGR04255 family)
MKLHFTKLPLVEVGINIMSKQGTEHTASRLLATMAYCERQSMQSSDAQITSETGGKPVSGIQFHDPESGLEILASRENLVITWRRRSDFANEYPRYEFLRSIVKTITELDESGTGADVVNIRYMNILNSADGGTLLSGYFSKEIVGLFKTLMNDSVQECTLRWKQDGLDRALLIREVLLSTPLSNPTLTMPYQGHMLTTVSGNQAIKGDTLESLDIAHQDAQVFFNDIISNHARAEWGFVTGD